MLCGTGQQGGVIERSGVPRLLSLRGRAWHAFGKKGRITDYQFIASSLRRLPLMNIGLPDLNPRSPRRREGVFPRLSGGLFVQFYRLDMHIISGTLREHQRQQAAARANIQHMLHSGNRRPGAQQNAVGTHLHVGSLVRDKLNAPELVRMMVGRPLSDLFNKERDIPRGQPRLRVEDLTDGGKVKPSSLVVHAGEIVGLAGLVGAGRSELAQLIFGVRKATAGVIEIDGEPVVIHSPREAIDLGIGFLTENRKEQGLFLELAAQENITMATLERDATWGMLNRRKAQTISDDAIQLLNIRVPHAQVRAGGLSGGNQQKLLISRWVAIGPRILILDEPTRGVDVGAKSEIYRIMNDMARQGVAILMISSELPEVVGMSDRVYVMREGVIAGELQAGDISQESIMTLATGVTDSHLKAGQL